MTVPVLILPGVVNSGPDHWQSHRERRDAARGLLAAPSDPADPNYPRGPAGFAPLHAPRHPSASGSDDVRIRQNA